MSLCYELISSAERNERQKKRSKRHAGNAHSVLIAAIQLPWRPSSYWGKLVSLTAQQRTTSQNLPFALYSVIVTATGYSCVSLWAFNSELSLSRKPTSGIQVYRKRVALFHSPATKSGFCSWWTQSLYSILYLQKSVEIQRLKMLTIIGALYYVGFINSVGVVVGVRRQRLVLSIGPIRLGSTWKRRQNQVSEKLLFK
jgi:hypothetical protein